MAVHQQCLNIMDVSGFVILGDNMGATKVLSAIGEAAAPQGSTGVTLRTVHTDDRGSITTLTLNDGGGPKEYIVIYTRKGHSRGGDYHPTAQHAILLEGKATWTLKSDRNNGLRLDTFLHELNTDFVIQPQVAHFFTAKENSLMITWLEGGRFEQHIDENLRSYMNSLRREEDV